MSKTTDFKDMCDALGVEFDTLHELNFNLEPKAVVIKRIRNAVVALAALKKSR